MSSVIHIPDSENWRSHLRNHRHLLVGCVLLSIAVHALALWLLPDWRRFAETVPVPVLDVVLAAREPEVVAPAPATMVPRSAPPREVSKRNPEPRPVAPRVPERNLVPAPLTRIAPDPVAAPAFTVPAAEPALAGKTDRGAAPAVSASPAAAAAAAPAPAAVPATPPAFNVAYLRNPPPRYPLAARRNGEQGTVLLKVLVSAEGLPLRVELDQSSGSSYLDTAALDAVRAWRFVPARRGAQNIEGWARVPVTFRLEG